MFSLEHTALIKRFWTRDSYLNCSIRTHLFWDAIFIFVVFFTIFCTILDLCFTVCEKAFLHILPAHNS
jgi:hypothetical protein